MRFRLRTLLIVLALGPPVLAWSIKHAPDELAFWRKDKPIQEVKWKPVGGGPFTILTLPTFKFPETEQEVREVEKLLAEFEEDVAAEARARQPTPNRP